MGEFLMGKEVSGTPIETRNLTKQLARTFGLGVEGGAGGRLGSQGISDMFGINLADLGLQDSIEGILSGGSAGLEEFQAAQQPERDRQVTSSRARNAGQFGTAGGRFSRNLQGANTASDVRFAEEFGAQDFDFFNTARQTDIAALSNVLQSIPGLQSAALAPLGMAASFAAPGAPGFQEGALGPILSTGASLASLFTGGFDIAALSQLLGGGQSGQAGRDQRAGARRRRLTS